MKTNDSTFWRRMGLMGMLGLLTAWGAPQNAPAMGHPVRQPMYTVQIGAFPMADSSGAVERHRHYVEQGQFAFLSRAEVNEQTWLRLRLGMFEKRRQAERFAASQALADFFIAKQELEISSHPFGINVIKTPSGLWSQSQQTYRRIFDLLPALLSSRRHTSTCWPVIAPDAESVVFEFDGKIYEVGLNSSKQQTWADEQIYRSFPQKSPSGNYIAFIDENYWEAVSQLWLLPEPFQPQPLVSTEQLNGHTVKFFQWHPRQDTLIFVAGYAYGTVSVGGSLYAATVSGEVFPLVQPGEREEIKAIFSVEYDSLFYEKAHFDADYRHFSTSHHGVPLASLFPPQP